MTRIPLLLPLLGILLLCAAPPAPAGAQLEATRHFDPPAVDGTIWCAMEHRGELVIGGRISKVGRLPVNQLAAWDGQAWRDLAPPLQNFAEVHSMARIDGLLTVGATHRHWHDGVTEHILLQLRDGVWSQLGPALPDAPLALTEHLGQLYVGLRHAITSRGERPVLRLNGDRWEDIGFPDGMTFIGTHTLLSHQGTLYVGGSFQSMTPWSHPASVFAWNAGSWWPVGDALQSYQPPVANHLPHGWQGAHDLEWFDGTLYAAGSFTDEARGISGLARWNGTDWESLGSVGSGFDLQATADGLVAVGILAHPVESGDREYYLGAWDGSRWNRLDPPGTSATSPVAMCATLLDGRLVLARDTPIPGADYEVQHGPSISMHTGQEWKSLIPGDTPGGPVWAMAIHEGRLVVAGNFLFAGATSAHGVAMLQAESWVGLGHGLMPVASSPEAKGGITRLVSYGGLLFANGLFYVGSDPEPSSLALWSGTEWQPVPTDGVVSAIAPIQGELLAAGDFTQIDAVAASGLARWDGETWRAWPVAGQDPEVGRGARVAIEYRDAVVIGGEGQLVSWDGSQWTVILEDEHLQIDALAVFQDLLYVASRETRQELGSLLQWDGDSVEYMTEPVPWHYSKPTIRALIPHQGRLYVAGSHLRPGDMYSRSFGIYDGLEWSDPDWGYGGLLYELRVSDAIANGNRLWVAGRFRHMNDPVPGHLVEFQTPTVVAVPSLELVSRWDGGGVHLSWSAQSLPSGGQLHVERRRPDGPWVRLVALDPATADTWTDREARPGLTFHYRVVFESEDLVLASPPVEAEVPTADLRPEGIVSAAPNPFNPAVTIAFEVRTPGSVRLDVFDVTGRRVRRLWDGPLSLGGHTRTWDGTDANGRVTASGTYLVVLRTGASQDVHRVTLLK